MTTGKTGCKFATSQYVKQEKRIWIVTENDNKRKSNRFFWFSGSSTEVELADFKFPSLKECVKMTS